MKQLGELQGIASELTDLGFTVVVVTGELPGEIRSTRKKTGLSLPMFSDPALTSAQGVGLAFVQTNEKYHKLLEESSGLDHHMLPVPAVFLADAEKTILFSHVDPNYRSRIPTGLLLEAARAYAADE